MSKNTNWKNLGRKQGATMKNFRNMKADKMMYNDGKWNTVYSDDDIKRLAYYNIDLPHVVGIGTNTPFSRLSFGDSSGSGDHKSSSTSKLTPGKLASIALHEKTVQEEDLDIKRGQEFNGIGYITKLRSVRSNINNTHANGVGIFSNKFISTTDTSQKTDKAIMYITDDKHVQIGGVPTGYKLIDRTINGSFISERQETGPNIILDVSGSVHINGFINFLKNGAAFPTPTQENDNPANQLTLDVESEPQQIKLCNTSDQTKTTNRAVPEGAIFVGFDKDPNSNTLSTDPRLYIMVGGEQKRIATEDDKEFYEENDSGFNFTGSNGIEGGSITTYVFRNPDDRPGNTLINTFDGITGDDFDGVIGGRNLPQTYDGNTLAPETSALQVLGNISVFDSKYGGTDLSPLNTGNLEKARQILVTEIYDNTSLENNPGRELGTVYTDRHIMIGGQKYSTNSTTPNLTFSHFGSAIDISGGITGKPAIRLISGGNKGSIKSSNPKDSIIIGNTHPDNFSIGNLTECILVGENTKYENNVNTLVMGNNNTVKNTKNSLIVGNNLDVSFNNTTKGVVVLGDGGSDNLDINGDDRIVFATNDGTTSKKALIIDKEGRVTISGDLNVEGDHVHLEVQRVVAKDAEIELNAKDDGTGNNNSEGASTLSGVDNGLSLFTTLDNTDTVKFSYDADNSRWTTAKSTSQVGLAVGGNPGSEKFVVDSTTGNVDMSGNLKVHGNTDISGKLDLSGNLNINDKFIVTASSGNTVVKGSLTVNDKLQVDNVKIDGNTISSTNTDGPINITPLGTGSVVISKADIGSGEIDGVKIGTNSPVTDLRVDNVKIDGNTISSTNTNGHINITTTGSGKIIMHSAYVPVGNGTTTSTGAEFVKNGNKVDLKISGKLDVDGDIDPTGLVLTSIASAPTTYSGKLALYYQGGSLKYTTDGTTVNTLAIGSTSGGSSGGGGSGLNAQVSANTGNITANTGNITSNAGNITANTGNITSNTGNITSNTGNITANTGNITANTGNITSNAGNITANTGNITSNAGNITANTGNITSNTGNITSNATAIDTKAPKNNPTFTGTVTVNDITMAKGSDRKIEVAESDTDGHNLTLKAGDGKTDNGRNGGNLNLNAGNGTTANQGSGTPGNIYLNPGSGNTTGIVEIGAGGGLNSVLQSASSKGLKIKSQANDIELQPTSNLIFNTSTIQVPKDKSCTLEIASQTISNDGKSFTISAGGSFGTNKNGGNLNLNGGAASTGTASNTKKGDVNINGDNVNITGNKIELNGTVTSTTNTNLVLTGSDSKPQIIMNGPFVSKINKLVNLWEEDKIVDITAQNLINGLFISLQKTAFNTSTHPDTCGLRLPAPWKVCDLFENVGAEGIIFEFYVEHMVSWNLRIRTHENTNDITTTNSRNGETNQGKWIYTGRLGSVNSFGPSVWESGDTKYGPMYNILGDEAGGYNGKKNVFDGNGGWTGIANETDNGTIIDSLYSGPRGYLEVKNSFFQKFICRIESAGYSSNNTKENAAIVIYTSNNNMNANNGVDSIGTSSI